MEKDIDTIIYSLVSTSVVIFAFLALGIARRAMKRGLTYGAFASVTWTLLFLAIARLWHTSYELLGGWNTFGEAGEFVEYALYLVAYGTFIVLNIRSSRLSKMAPSEKTVSQPGIGA